MKTLNNFNRFRHTASQIDQGMTVKTKGFFSCLCFLLIACLTMPAWGGERDMTVEAFAKKLEESRDWPREKLEALLDVKFTDNSPGEGKAAGRFVYGKGLIVSQISHKRLPDTRETLSLYVLLNEESSCFTWDRLEKMYPNAEKELAPGELWLYVYKASWGEMEFGFGPEPITKGDRYCLTSIRTRTNKFLEILEERFKKYRK